MTTERIYTRDGTMYVDELDAEGRVVESRAYSTVMIPAAAAALEAVADRPVTATVPIDIDDIRFLTFATEVLKRQPPIVADLAPIKAEIDAFHKLSVELPLPAPTKTKRGPQLSKREMRQRQMQHNRRGGR